VTRVAAVDCGTNSIRLLVADVTAGGLVELTRQMEIVRLGAGVDRTGAFAPDALRRTLAALRGYADQIERFGAERVRMVATSATRDAANRDELVQGVRAILGVDPEVITGDTEAALSFAGATAELATAELAVTPGTGPGDGRVGDRRVGGQAVGGQAVGGQAVGGLGAARSPVLVADIGGGSTELVLGTLPAAAEAGAARPGGTVTAARSVNVGCVRLAERHLHDDPPSAAQIGAVVADAHAAFDLAEQVVPLRSAASLVGVAGTVTTVAALAHDLPAYDAERIHLSVVSAEDVAAVTDRLIHMTHDERAALAVMHPGRVDVIASGALVLRTLVERCGVPEIIASERDILDGIAFSLAEPSAASASSGSARTAGTAGTGNVVPPADAAYAEPAERG